MTTNVVEDGISGLIRRIPKADIHVHFEGLVTPKLFAKLADRNGLKTTISPATVFRGTYGSLNGFIDACRAANSVIRTEEDCFDLVSDYLRASAKETVVHVELACEPEFHQRRGLRYEALLNGIKQALELGWREFGISYCLILSLARDLPEEVANENFNLMRSGPVDVGAIGLASREQDNPPIKFCHVFERARKAGYRLVMHAGEESPASYVWEALLEIGVDRIDHGVRAVEDASLMKFLAACQTPIATCPMSNIRTCCVANKAEQSIGRMLRSGLMVSINTDDPGILQAGLVENYRAVVKECSLNADDIVKLARNSIVSSFLDQRRKDAILKQIAECARESCSTEK